MSHNATQSSQDSIWDTLIEIVSLIACLLVLAALGVLAMAATP